MLEVICSRARQKRLLDRMAERKLDAVVVGLPHHVYYLSAAMPHWLHCGAFILFSDGRAWLTSGNKAVENAAADEAVSFEAAWMSTLRPEQPEVVGQQVVEALRVRKSRRIGIDTSAVTAQIALMAGDLQMEAMDPILWQLRRAKDPDELALMRKAIKCTEAMFRRAREIIEPGVAEVEVFAQLQAAAVREAGEPMSNLLGNDYASGPAGGPPRLGRTAQVGEMYVIDVGPCYRGYFADCCRAFSIDHNPTDAQMKAWQDLVGALSIVEKMAKPGVRCRYIYAAVMEHLNNRLPHHLGHGIGLVPHEFPHLNPKWDDVLIEGEIFAAEPGLYEQDLRGGIRLENDYLVTATGVERLNDSPLELA
jgi:Xaa-Pro aminopeptidase